MRRLIPSILLAVVCAVCFCLPLKVGFEPGMPFWNAITYHFFHANIFHLGCNLLALYYFKPRWMTLLVSWVVASLCALIPVCQLTDPTYGLSAVVFAAYARKYAGFRYSLWPVAICVMITVPIPCVNWRIHVMSFLLSYLIWRIYYGRFYDYK